MFASAYNNSLPYIASLAHRQTLRNPVGRPLACPCIPADSVPMQASAEDRVLLRRRQRDGNLEGGDRGLRRDGVLLFGLPMPWQELV